MLGPARWDALKTLLYAAASVALAATLSSPLFNAGKALAEVTESKRTNDVLNHLAAVCREANFGDFFAFTFAASALALFFPWLASLRLGARGPATKPWRVKLPAGRLREDQDHPLRPNPHGLLHGATGFLLAAGLFLLVGFALLHAGSFVWKPDPPAMAAALGSALALSLIAALVQELVFRGAVLGVFARAFAPTVAIAASACLFALARFLMAPPSILPPRDEEALGAGWEFLGNFAVLLTDPRVLLGTLLPLFTIGAILGFARLRTASLWLPIGLHAGWLFAERAFAAVANPLERADPLAQLLAGRSLATGLVPLTCVIFTGILLHFLTFPRDDAEASVET